MTSANVLVGGCSANPSDGSGHSAEALGSDGLVISGVYGGGGNSGATFSNDFVELFNRGTLPVSMAGMSLQYGPASADFANPITLPGGVTIQPGGYFLVQLASNVADSGAFTQLPTPDLSVPGTNMAAANGKIALANVTTPLACGGATRCPSTNIVDMVGYGTATDYEGPTGSAVGVLSATTGAYRKVGGCTDSNVNLADFDIANPVTAPRNSATTLSPCGVLSGDAGSDAMDDGATADDGAADGGTDGSSDDATPPDDGGTDGSSDDGSATDGSSDDGAPTDGGTDATPPNDASVPPNAGNGLVISQVFGGGGNSGALVDRDYVEIFNRSAFTVSTEGLSIQYGSAARDFGTPLPDGGPSQDILALPTISIKSGQYVLVGMSSSNLDAGAALPTVDVSGNISMAATNGKIALARGTAGLGCGGATRCTTTNIVDMIGYGPTATDYEGSGPTAVLSSSLAALRKGNGCTDTNDTKADFDVAAPAPRNSSSPKNACKIDPGPGNDSGAPGPDDSGTSFEGGFGGPDDSGSGNGPDANLPNADNGSADTGGCNVTAQRDASGTAGFLLFAIGFLAVRRRRVT